jgi:nicotinamidase/pyrazinamidase
MKGYENSVLLVTDVQNDFCPGGSLAVNEGDRVVPVINRIIRSFTRIVATQDWHPQDHISFAVNHPGKKVHDVVEVDGMKQVLWPMHCVQGTSGADFHPALHTENFALILHKGMNPRVDSYSTFTENDKQTVTGLEGYLKGLGIASVYLCGLATDYCILYSALDAVDLGFKTHVVLDACRGVDVPDGNVAKSVKTMQEHGIILTRSSELS